MANRIVLQLCKSSLQHMACIHHGNCVDRVHFCDASTERHRKCPHADKGGAVHIATGIKLPAEQPILPVKISGKKSYKRINNGIW